MAAVGQWKGDEFQHESGGVVFFLNATDETGWYYDLQNERIGPFRSFDAAVDALEGVLPGRDHDIECICELCDPDGEYLPIAPAEEVA